VLVRSEQLGDLGAEDHDSFLDIYRLGLGSPDEPPFTNGRLENEFKDLPVLAGHLETVSGLTVNSVSGNAGTIAGRMSRYNAQVESMEGAALHYVCLQMGMPFLQVRAISNYVTPRDRAAWKIEEALIALNAQLIDWLRQLA
jgi:futalosine hydrolase